MRDGHHLIGWGVAAGTYPVRRTPGEAMVRILSNGAIEVSSSGIDMGQGTYTILAQTAAEALGIPVEPVEVKLGDSSLPRAPVAGGSQLANLMTGAVHVAAARSPRRAHRPCDQRSEFAFPWLAGEYADHRGWAISSPRDAGSNLSISELLRRLGREQYRSPARYAS